MRLYSIYTLSTHSSPHIAEHPALWQKRALSMSCFALASPVAAHACRGTSTARTSGRTLIVNMPGTPSHAPLRLGAFASDNSTHNTAKAGHGERFIQYEHVHWCEHGQLGLTHQMMNVQCLAQIAKHTVDLAEVVVEAEIFPRILNCLKDMDVQVRKNAAMFFIFRG